MTSYGVPVLVHAHVERTVTLNAEAASRHVVLHRRRAGVEEEAIDVAAPHAVRRQQLGDVTEAAQQRHDVRPVVSERLNENWDMRMLKQWCKPCISITLRRLD